MDSLTTQQKYFEQYLNGDPKSLFYLFDIEIPLLFDYLFRMTGKFDESINFLHLVKSYSLPNYKKQDSLQSFRKNLFIEIKSRAKSLWNADTDHLENLFFNKNLDHQNSSYFETIENPKRMRIDRIISLLPEKKREAILLNACYNFSLEDAAEILDETKTFIENEVSIVIAQIEQEGLGKNYNGLSALQDIALHPIPPAEFEDLKGINELLVREKNSDEALKNNGIFSLLRFVIVGLLLFFVSIFLPRRCGRPPMIRLEDLFNF